ncbi:MAG TPA: response regulator [Thermodesulfobacteriota bacterium]|nr:response regulator [Thermodesulfobacteriota bacterium]
MKTILIADEDIRVRNLVRLTFTEHMGYKVVAVSNGADAILKARETKPDISLIDVSLSNQNGYRVSREIKSNPLLKNVYIILLRSAFVAFDEKKVFGVLADDIITKPFEPGELTKKVLGHFERKEAARSLSSSKEKIRRNKDIALAERSDDTSSEERKSDYTASLAVISQPIVKVVKNFYLTSKACAEGFKIVVKKINRENVTPKLALGAVFFKQSLPCFIEAYGRSLKQWLWGRSFKASLPFSFRNLSLWFSERVESFRRIVRGGAERLRTSTGKLKEKIVSPAALISKKNFSNNFRGFYGALGFYKEPIKSAISDLRERVIPYEILQRKSFKFPSPPFDKKYSFVTALGIGTILLISIPFVLADKREEKTSSSSGASASIFNLPELKSSSEKEKVKYSDQDTTITKEKFQGIEVKKSKKQGPAQESATKKESTRVDKYVIRRGDTLWGIANKYNVSLDALKAVNNLRGDNIYVGKVLAIPQGVVRKEVTRWDIVGTTTHSGGIRILDWSFYMPWSGVAVIHHVFIENTSDKNYKNIKVRILYYSSSDDNRTKRGEIIATLPIFVPRNSKNVYLEDGISIRGNFNTNGMHVTKGGIEIVEAAASGYSQSYSSRW